MIERKDFERREPEIVYSRSLKAGKRLYYLDVKRARNEDLYLCITESKRKALGEDELPTFEKHKLFLYKEDFESFSECLQDVMNYVSKQFGTIEKRQEYVPQQDASEQPSAEIPSAEADEVGAAAEDATDESADVAADVASEKAQPVERRSFFQRLRRKD